MNYNKLTPELKDELAKLVKGKIFTGADIADEFQHDELPIYGSGMPEAVVEAADKEDIRATLKFCNDHKIALVTRGAGTGLAGGSTPIHGGVVLYVGKLNKILSFDEENFTVTLEPGVFNFDLAAAAAERGFLYAPDPGEKFGTIGGNVSTNAGGMRAVKYGCTRESVKALKVMLTNGEEIEVGRPVNKYSSGYSLLHLMIGSEGTLGVITELTMKLFPLVKENITCIVPFENIRTAIAAVPELLKANLKPQACEYMPLASVNSGEKYIGKVVFPHDVDGIEPQAYLLVTFEDDDMDALETTVEKGSEVLLENGALDVFVLDTPARKKDLWDLRHDLLDAMKADITLMDECDVVVPPTKMADFVEFAEAKAAELGLGASCAGHAGDGNIHCYCTTNEFDEKEFMKRARVFMLAAFEKANEFKGAVSGEHGIGHSKVEFLEKFVGPTQMEIMRGIKKVFDPNMILNPGKVCMDPEFDIYNQNK